MEQWKPIPSYEDSYEISTLGRVRSLRTGRVLKPAPCGKKLNHRFVSLSRRGERYSALVHRLVLKAFVGECPDGMECCHGNGIASDNRIENLRWDTRSANARDAIRHGTFPLGEKHNKAKLTAVQVREIRDIPGDRLGRGVAIRLAQKFGVHKQTIVNARSSRFWRSVH